MMEFDADIDIKVTEDVYPPSDDSLLLIESFDVQRNERVLEIGCGSGIVSIHCAKNGAKVTAVDVNPEAVKCTKANAERNSVNIDCYESDCFENVKWSFDTIVFNLPYLPVSEDGLIEKAWSGGEFGVEPLPILLPQLKEHLTENGRFIIVYSSLTDEKKMKELLRDFSVRELNERSFFFETIKVCEIRPPANLSIQ